MYNICTGYAISRQYACVQSRDRTIVIAYYYYYSVIIKRPLWVDKTNSLIQRLFTMLCDRLLNQAYNLHQLITGDV